MNDDQRKAMFARMQTPQGSRQSTTSPYLKYPSTRDATYAYGKREQLLSYLRNSTNQEEKEKAKELLNEYNKTHPLRVAESKKGKHQVVLKADDIVMNNGRVIEGYTIETYQNGSLTASQGSETTSRREAEKEFDDTILGWNKLNVKLGKLYEKDIK